jgi:hypothetical protein
MVAIESISLNPPPGMSLDERRDVLYQRLERGYETIENAALSGEEIARWEQGWLRLLREYEQICDMITSRSS